MTQDLTALLEADRDPDELLGELMGVLGRTLDCDRCLLFLRHPATGLSRMTHGWTRRSEFEFPRDDRGWQPEPETLAADDPMFAEALRNPEALYIDDIETADPALVNVAYEREHFGHRALIHAPVFHDGAMYGILEPCVFGTPRAWRDQDREAVSYVQARVAAPVARYVEGECG